MRGFLGLGLGLGLLTVAPALAEPSLQIRHAAVKVVVIPEARQDVEVRVVRSNPGLPLFIERFGDTVIVDGRLPSFLMRCHGSGADFGVSVFGRGDFSNAELPQIVVRTPLDVRVSAGGAVQGAIDRSRSLMLNDGGCSAWTLANVEGHMEARLSGIGQIVSGSAGSAELTLSGSGRLEAGAIHNLLAARVSGSGAIKAASAGAADLVISGSGDVNTGPVRALSAEISGSGDLNIARVDGPVSVSVSGVGHVNVPAGRVTTMQAHISGSGDVSFGGVAESLDAAVSGSGDIAAAAVTGSVTKHISGSGRVRVGP